MNGPFKLFHCFNFLFQGQLSTHVNALGLQKKVLVLPSSKLSPLNLQFLSYWKGNYTHKYTQLYYDLYSDVIIFNRPD